MPNHMTTGHETFLYYLNSIAASSNKNPISSHKLFLDYLPDAALEHEASLMKQAHDGLIRQLTNGGYVRYEIIEDDILIAGFTPDGEKLRDLYNSISRI